MCALVTVPDFKYTHDPVPVTAGFQPDDSHIARSPAGFESH